ncbi:copper resistance CopC family protein [Glycomyces sp. NPDC046736]|uniref:copper resistance CopC family protein n=1 Tax=Glycomyces sp. NPDC046736 TaxID=3155615 RepID=UPI00340E6535
MRNHQTTRVAAGLLAALCGTVLALASAAPASAHAAVVGTDPEDGATLDTAPASVSATFSEILDGPSTTIAVTGPDGEVVEVEAAEYDGDTFTQPMRYTVPGEYTLAYRVISEDGHRIDGSVTFTVAQIPTELLDPATAPTTEADSEATEGATTEAEPTEASTTAAAAEDDDTGATIAVVLLCALVVVAGAVLLVRAMRKRAKAES